MKFLKEIKPAPRIVDKHHYMFNADCLNILEQFPNNKIRLIVTDPPYNIGLKYNGYKDNKKWVDYYRELKEKLKKMYNILTDDGSLYLINYPEVNAKILPMLEDIGYKFKRWLTWHYPSNIGHSKKNFTRSQRSIIFCTKTKNNLFNKDNIAQPYKNPNVDKIKKLIEKGQTGRTPYDTLNMQDLFEIHYENLPDVLYFNLLKNVSKDRAGSMKKSAKDHHPCQLPPSLLKVFIKASSNKGDFVLDPFAGTFTTSYAAKQLGRKSIGIEIDRTYLNLGIKRLEDAKKKKEKKID